MAVVVSLINIQSSVCLSRHVPLWKVFHLLENSDENKVRWVATVMKCGIPNGNVARLLIII